MRWADFTHAIRAAAGILSEQEIVVLGSQAIHATFKDEELPPAALASMEIDITVLDDPDGTKSDILSGAIGDGRRSTSPSDSM